MKRLFITVKGIVQGVGFRPFVYNLALKFNLSGWVNNNSEGVYIDIEGSENDLLLFIDEIKYNPPLLSKVEQVFWAEKDLACFQGFKIKESESKENSITLISPDIATCAECTTDIDNPDGRRYMYPFTNCTNCGPRFSIIKAIPYDRDKTTMAKFIMCRDCSEEYHDPGDRRFHAQPDACGKCGPHVNIFDNSKVSISPAISVCSNINEDYTKIQWSAQRLRNGFIMAIKGLTGFNLCCDALNDDSVRLLRERKRRPHKPFAVMMRDMDTIRKYCLVDAEEERLLTGIRKPIVLLRLKESTALSPSLAPGQNTLGVMLPYTPLHHILFRCDIEVLVMTSANLHGLPLEYKNDTAFEHLKDIADYFLIHDRDIHIPVDDSVTRVTAGRERIIRRARGYAPEPFIYEETIPILACGSNMKNTFCISKENFLFLSQHNGDLENLETYTHYVNNIEHFKQIFLFAPEYIAADLHPEYYSTKYAMESSLPVIQIQHHHAHIVSCMAENKVEGPVIGLAFDGTGYGTDGCIWGGEFLICSLGGFKRAAHLKYIQMPGGDKAVLEPWRMAASYLYSHVSTDSEEIAGFLSSSGLQAQQIKPLLRTLEKNINCINTSSIGRLFDAVSAILNICTRISYEGQASMELEALIPESSIQDSYPYDIESENLSILNPGRIIKGILRDKALGINNGIISAKFHNAIVDGAVEICARIRNVENINEVALSGGVFQNSYLLRKTLYKLQKKGFTVYTHSLIPCNDGGVSLGQLIAANEIIKGRSTSKIDGQEN
ncbi:MAG: carbamoyltransferase HypF [Bacillota bacterium]|nr:carbamoyltransferase HypF [Bacillota bacterium]